MDKTEAIAIVEKDLESYRVMSYAEIAKKIGEAESFERISDRGEPYQIEFANNICRLFRLRDFLEGGKAVGPITKVSIRAGVSPYVLYASVSADSPYLAMDAWRKPGVDRVINELCKHFRLKRRAHYEAIFRHIVDGGDGYAPQRQAGGGVPSLTDKEIKQLIERWDEEKRSGVSLANFLDKPDVRISEATFYRYRGIYRDKNLNLVTFD